MTYTSIDNRRQRSGMPKCLTLNGQIFILLITITISACRADLSIMNPYSQVDWENHRQYKANLHTHTTRSDGSLSPQCVVDNYSRLGYNILALTDHNELTYPWQEFNIMKPSAGSREKVERGKLDTASIVYESRNPEKLNMLAVQGSEISSPQHLGCYFTGNYHAAKNEDTVLIKIAADNGLVIFNHPGKYTRPASWYCNYLTKYKHIVGVEAYNQGNRYPNDLMFWDSILIKMMPERMVWGFSNDDMHRIVTIGKTWNVFVMPDLSVGSLRKAMEQGCFFFVLAPKGHEGQKPPVIHSITVRKRKSIIHIEASGQDSVRWVSNGKVIHRGQTIDLKQINPDGKYVRAELYGADGTFTGTQPFGMVKN